MKKKKQGHTTKEVVIRFDNNDLAAELFGPEDAHLRSLENHLAIEAAARGNSLMLKGSAHSVEMAEDILSRIYNLLKKGHPIVGADIERSFHLLSRDKNADLEGLFADSIFLPAKKRVIVPRSPSQKLYIESIKESDVVFSIGPAGTGKSYLAVAVAVSLLLRKQFDKIILARPAIEAGEKLGFLPGDMLEKVNPYLRPLYDALYDMLERDKVEELIDEDVIEIAPLAFMRGRTLHRSFVIIDEAQNCSYHQMKMCLTRLGNNSKMVVNGDITQTDLPSGQPSGLIEALRILKGVPGIAFHKFTENDIVRHPIVGDIVSAYERDEGKNGR